MPSLDGTMCSSRIANKMGHSKSCSRQSSSCSVKVKQCLNVSVLGVLAVFLILLPTSFASANIEVMKVDKSKLQFCSFFGNRAPNIQLGLKNCTWFKENSCCRQKEIDAIFGRVKPLRGASPMCQRYTNYLMCYICAPNQNTFYMQESLTVCEEFCDAWYQACQSAILKGSVIKGLYSNGSEFCVSRRFNVAPLATKRCFFFDAKFDKNRASAAPSNFTPRYSTVLVSLIIALASFHHIPFKSSALLLFFCVPYLLVCNANVEMI